MASPLMFDSDDGENNTSAAETLENEEETDFADPRNAASLKELKVLKGLQTVLTGIPPPPAFTVPQFDSREILKLWRDNQRYRVEPTPYDEDKIKKARLLEKEAKTTSWPNILQLNHFDVSYNRSLVSEEIEKLCVKYQERYVGVETSSCINALYAKSPVRTASARKRQRNRAWGHSPGRRLSYLARRRKVFSSASLQSCSVAGNNNPDKKMIMVEIKKTANRQKKKNSAKKKNSGKKAKPTPNKNQQANTFKRALFQSPDQLPTDNATRTPNTQCIQRSKRNLFAESSSEKVNENGKRERLPERRVSPRKRVNRSLSFQESGNQLNQSTSSQPQSSSGSQPTRAKSALSQAHRQKLLWACANALGQEGVKQSKHKDLHRDCMQFLFRSCEKFWLSRVAKGEFREGNTSDNMAMVVKPYATRIVSDVRKIHNSAPNQRKLSLQNMYNEIMKLGESYFNPQGISDNINVLGRCSHSKENGKDKEQLKVALQKTPVKRFASKVNNSPRRSSPRLKSLFDNNSVRPVNAAGPSCSVKTTPVKESSPRLNKTPKTSKVTPKRIYGDLRIMLSAMKEKADSLQKKNKLESNSEGVNESKENPLDITDDVISLSCTSEQEGKNDASGQNLCPTTRRLQGSNADLSESLPFSKNKLKEHQPSKLCPTENKSNTRHSKFTEINYRITRRRSQETNNESNSSKENADDSDTEELQSPVKSKNKLKSDQNNLQNVNKSSPLKSSNSVKALSSPNKLMKRRKSNSERSSAVASTMFSPEKDEFEIIHKTIAPLLQSPITRSRGLISSNETTNVTSNSSPVVHFKSVCQIPSRRTSETRSPIKCVSLSSLERRISLLTEERKTEPSNLLLRRISLRSASTDSAKYVDFDDLSTRSAASESSPSVQDSENKENDGNQLLLNSFVQRHLDQGNLLVDDTPKNKITQSDPANRTLELYKLSNSGGEQVETDHLHPISVCEEPPRLVPHWELVSTSSESSQSPPSLQPHWEHLSQESETSTGTGTSLPESIMTHWQQIANMKKNSCDKIMFDFEDTSYEINFPPTNDDSEASSICPPIDFPFLIDDSKSGFQHR